MAEQVTSRDGTPIGFDRYGEGPGVLLVGGAFQHRAIDPATARLAELLGERFTVLHYDRRGRGDSGDTRAYAVEREIEDLAALMEETGARASIFGMSSGAVLALRAAAAALPVHRLVLYEPPFQPDEGARAGTPVYRRNLEALLDEGRWGDAAALAMRNFGTPPEMVEAMRETPHWERFESVAPTLAYDAAVMGDGSVPFELLASVDAPTLVIDGGDSPAWMREATRLVAEGLPHGRRRTLEGQTHDVDPGVLAPVVIEFLDAASP